MAQSRITTKFDRTVYHIDSLLLSGTASTIDVLKKIPDLFVDNVYDAVSIKGMENTMVMLNGVLNPMDTKLKSIDPQDIEKVRTMNIDTKQCQNPSPASATSQSRWALSGRHTILFFRPFQLLQKNSS